MASRKRSISNDSDLTAMYKEWDEASCPICMDHPHNAVLLICTSHGKGCRSYICDTSYRHSNCLDRFKKLKENADSLSAARLIPGNHHGSVDNSTRNLDPTTSIDVAGGRVDRILGESNSAAAEGVSGGSNTQDTNSDLEDGFNFGELNMENSEEGLDLRCPLCRGIVLGWKVVEEARKYLNLKSRSCSRESCSFSGNYRELRGHARRIHPTARPADIDPSRQRDWRRLEDQREYSDIVSAIRSAMPGAVVFGDYVIENGDRRPAERDRSGGAGEGGRLLSTLFLFQIMDSMDSGAELRGGRSRALPRHRRATGNFARRRYLWGENLLGLQNEDEEDDDDNDEPDLNLPSDLGDDGPPRRRRRLTRAQSHEDEQ